MIKTIDRHMSNKGTSIRITYIYLPSKDMTIRMNLPYTLPTYETETKHKQHNIERIIQVKVVKGIQLFDLCCLISHDIVLVFFYA